MRTQTPGELNSLAASQLELALYHRRDEQIPELERIDLLTPVYRRKLERLSVQKRKVFMALFRQTQPRRVKDLTGITRIYQQNQLSSILTRLVQEGLVQRLPNRQGYQISQDDPDFILFLYARHSSFAAVYRSAQSKTLIPDRENPITYFKEHNQEINQQRFN